MDQSLFTLVQTEDGRIILPAHPIHYTAFQDLYARSRGQLHPKSEDTITIEKDRLAKYGDACYNYDEDLQVESRKLYVEQVRRRRPKFAFRPVQFLEEDHYMFKYGHYKKDDDECVGETEDGKKVFAYIDHRPCCTDWNSKFSNLGIIVEKQTEEEEK